MIKKKTKNNLEMFASKKGKWKIKNTITFDKTAGRLVINFEKVSTEEVIRLQELKLQIKKAKLEYRNIKKNTDKLKIPIFKIGKSKKKFISDFLEKENINKIMIETLRANGIKTVDKLISVINKT